jgi:hypothetical protein
MSLKKPVIPPGIDPGTVRLVACKKTIGCVNKDFFFTDLVDMLEV